MSFNFVQIQIGILFEIIGMEVNFWFIAQQIENKLLQ